MIARRAVVGVVFLLAVSGIAFSQQRVDPRNMYERLMTVVPFVGKGTFSDPKRPMYAPAPSAIQTTSRAGILGFSYVPSDDGKYALVEFVAQNRTAFNTILGDKSLKCFLKGKDTKDDVIKEFKKYKKDFDFDKIGARLP